MRKVTISGAPFDFRHSPVSIQAFSENGEFSVKDVVADYIVENKLGTEGWAPGSKTKSVKGGPARQRARGSAKAKATPGTGKALARPSGKGATKAQLDAMVATDAGAANSGANSTVDGAGLADANSASARNE